MSTKDKVFDPFSGDPADVGPVKPEKCSFNPDVSPFTPGLDLSSWQVVAAEYTGKAVAVMAGAGENKLHVCTSPSFNSKCRHSGVACLDWDNVKVFLLHFLPQYFFLHFNDIFLCEAEPGAGQSA